MDTKKSCKLCGNPRDIKGRRLCKKCNSERVKKYYNKEKRNKSLSKQCPVCKENKPFHRKTQAMCGDCYRESLSTGSNTSYYISKKGTSKHYHRALAESLLERELSYNEIVHHVNDDNLDNRKENLWVMSRSDHGKLHIFLRQFKMLNKNKPYDIYQISENWVNDNNISIEKLP